MSQKPERKVLRVGLIRKGVVLKEHLLLQREPVTIGVDERCTFHIPIEGLPPRYPLFKVVNGAYVLQFSERMTGKVNVGDQFLDFPTLIEKGISTPSGRLHLLTLDDSFRGKIDVGDLTLLFQFIAPPPPRLKVKVPAAFQRSIWDTLDWHFVNCLLASLVLQAGSITFITTREYPEKELKLADIPNRFLSVIVKPKPPEPPPDQEKPVDDDKGEPKDSGQEAETAADDEPLPADTPENKAQRTAILTDRVQRKTLLGFLAVSGDGPASGLVGELSGEAARVSMAEAFKGAGLAMADSASLKRRAAAGDSEGGTIDVDDSRLVGGERKAVSTGRKVEKAPTGNLKMSAPSEAVGTGSLSRADIEKTVTRRAGALKSCYESELKKDNTLKGKIEVQFTIQPSGRVSAARVTTNTMSSPAVGACIVAQIQRWRFPQPSGGDVTIKYPFVFTPSN